MLPLELGPGNWVLLVTTEFQEVPENEKRQ